jgi:hypothetical protein
MFSDSIFKQLQQIYWQANSFHRCGNVNLVGGLRLLAAAMINLAATLAKAV